MQRDDTSVKVNMQVISSQMQCLRKFFKEARKLYKEWLVLKTLSKQVQEATKPLW